MSDMNRAVQHRAGGGVELALVAGAVALGVALRLGTTSDLWLDEATSVAIARLPVGDLLEALRDDGHPPLYYLLLHGWIEVFGDGDVAVRSLSAVCSLASLPLLWLVARRHGGRTVAAAGLVVAATAPFAIRHATESRMYALVVLLVLAGWLALQRALARPTLPALLAVAVASGLLCLTHYWAFYLLAAVAVVLVVRGARAGPGQSRRGTLSVLGALLAGGVLFLPWLPSFLEQAAETGTPWGTSSRPGEVVTELLFASGGGDFATTGDERFAEAPLLGVLYAGLAAVGLLGAAAGRWRVELDLRTRPTVRTEAVVLVLTLAFGIIGAALTNTAVEPRYTAVVFPVLVVVVAFGVGVLGSATARWVALGAAIVLGLAGGLWNARVDRTQMGDIGRAVAAEHRAGDVVAFCPDQLGPSTTRHLPGAAVTVLYPDPRPAPADRLDWGNYERRMRRGDPAAFAEEVHRRAGDNRVWLVWSGGYRHLEGSCEAVAAELARRRTPTELVAGSSTFEHGALLRFDQR